MKTHLEQYMEHRAELAKKVYLEDGFVVLNTGNTLYEISVDRIYSHEVLVNWAFHLTEKVWMDMDMMREFRRVASIAAKLPLEGV